MARKDELKGQATAMGITVPAKATVAQIESMIAAAAEKPVLHKVSRPVRKRGRKSLVKSGMIALVNSWDSLEVGDTVILPDSPVFSSDAKKEQVHSALTLARYHFKKYAKVVGLDAGTDYTIEFSPEDGAVITRLR